MADAATYPSLNRAAVFITGGASGIGAAMAKAFARQGSRVGIIDRDGNGLMRLVESLNDMAEIAPWARTLDVADTDALQAAIRDFSADAGKLDALINNVANDNRHDPLETDANAWRQTLAINLDSAFFAAQAAIPVMQKQNQGAIITLSSINALLGPANMPGYVAAKGGLVSLSKSLANEYGADGIRANTILPGWVVTERQLDLWLTPEAEAEWMKQVALKERIMPSDVANLALFLASDAARMITGQSIVIDGGRT